MRLRWLLSVIFSLATVSPALACEEWLPNISLTASIEPGINAGTLVLAFHNPNSYGFTMPMRVRAEVIDYDWLTVELSNAHTTRTLRFIHDREKAVQEDVTLDPQGTHVEKIDLDPLTHDLPRGQYTVKVTWSAPSLEATTTTHAPFRCGLEASRYLGERDTPSPSKLPYVLGALAFASLLVGWRLSKRGFDDARVPHSLP